VTACAEITLQLTKAKFSAWQASPAPGSRRDYRAHSTAASAAVTTAGQILLDRGGRQIDLVPLAEQQLRSPALEHGLDRLSELVWMRESVMRLGRPVADVCTDTSANFRASSGDRTIELLAMVGIPAIAYVAIARAVRRHATAGDDSRWRWRAIHDWW